MSFIATHKTSSQVLEIYRKSMPVLNTKTRLERRFFALYCNVVDITIGSIKGNTDCVLQYANDLTEIEKNDARIFIYEKILGISPA